MPLSDTASTFASRTIARLLERLAYQVGSTAHSPTAEKVHDLRVAVRRFEQSLVRFGDALPGREVKRIRRRLKVLMDRAGAVRDCDVVMKLLAKCEEAGAAAVQERVAEERKSNLPALAAALRRWSQRRTSSKWRAALLPLDQHDPVDLHLPKAARKFLAHGNDAAQQKASAGDLHAFRIETKKLRYTLEILEPMYGAPVRDWLEKLKPVQSALGDAHDARMARGVAGDFDAAPAVESWLKKRQRKKTREFRTLWEQTFGASAEARRLVAALHHTPRKPMGRSTAPPGAAVRNA